MADYTLEPLGTFVQMNKSSRTTETNTGRGSATNGHFRSYYRSSTATPQQSTSPTQYGLVYLTSQHSGARSTDRLLFLPAFRTAPHFHHGSLLPPTTPPPQSPQQRPSPLSSPQYKHHTYQEQLTLRSHPQRSSPYSNHEPNQLHPSQTLTITTTIAISELYHRPISQTQATESRLLQVSKKVQS